MLELYQFEACPFSAQVRAKMSEWKMDYLLRNVSKDKSRRHRVGMYRPNGTLQDLDNAKRGKPLQ